MAPHPPTSTLPYPRLPDLGAVFVPRLDHGSPAEAQCSYQTYLRQPSPNASFDPNASVAPRPETGVRSSAHPWAQTQTRCWLPGRTVAPQPQHGVRNSHIRGCPVWSRCCLPDLGSTTRARCSFPDHPPRPEHGVRRPTGAGLINPGMVCSARPGSVSPPTPMPDATVAAQPWHGVRYPTVAAEPELVFGLQPGDSSPTS